MILSKKLGDIQNIFGLDENIFISTVDSLLSLKDANKKILFDQYKDFYSYKYFYKIHENSIEIFDNNLNSRFNFEYTNVEGVLAIFKDDYFVFKDSCSSEFIIVFAGEINFKGTMFYGKIINSYFRLNFPNGRYINPEYFRCSDLKDSTTYWDYTCPKGYKCDRFYVWKEEVLVFCITNGEKYRLLNIALSTGEILWNTEIIHRDFNFDRERGVLVSLWGNKYYGNGYQIIYLENQGIEIGKIETDYELESVMVHWQQQSLSGDKVYFSNNYATYGDAPGRFSFFGCFDIITKQIDFFQEVTESFGAIQQVVYHDYKLYLRINNGDLLVYEQDDI